MKKNNNVISVIVVEDSKSYRQHLMSILPEYGFNIKYVGEDGEAAIKLASKNDADLIILDITMPKIHGLTALKRIRAFNKDIKVVFLTNNEGRSFINTAKKQKANGYISKNEFIEDIAEALKTIVKTNSFVELVDSEEDFPENDIPIDNRIEEYFMWHNQGYVNKEIAVKMGISEDTGKELKKRAKARIKTNKTPVISGIYHRLFN